MATATKTAKVATKSVIKVRLADGIVTRKSSPIKQENGWWKASVTLAGKKVKVYRKSGRGIKTFELESNMNVRDLKAARS